MCYYCPAERSDASAVGGRYPRATPVISAERSDAAPLGGATPALPPRYPH